MNHPPPQYSAQPAPAPKLHEYTLRKKYRSQLKLKQSLDCKFGEGTWEVKLRKERWIVCSPKPMSPDELQSLDDDVYQHYDA
ncbi:hypothetical protein PG990_009250 [Apiospora arundinis]